MNIASIDIGTNTVLLLIAQINPKDKSIKTIRNEYRMPRIGKGLQAGKNISKEKTDLLFEVLDEYHKIIERYNCEEVLLAGTNAMRLALNGKAIIDAVLAKWNYKINIIPGVEEARLSYLGATFSGNKDKNVVIDIGGGSTEIIYGGKDEIFYSKSFAVGAVSLTENYFIHNPPLLNEIEEAKEKIKETFNEISEEIHADIHTIAVAGTPTSLAGIKLHLTDYDETQIEDLALTQSDLRDFIGYFSSRPSNKLLEEQPVFLAGREDIILAGTIILTELMSLLKINNIFVSTRGIRYGLVVDYIKKQI